MQKSVALPAKLQAHKTGFKREPLTLMAGSKRIELIYADYGVKCQT